MAECIVLLSVGRNPVSGRRRLSLQEASAIAMAARAGLAPVLVHAGSPGSAPILRPALGLGATRLDILAMPEEADPLGPLTACLKERAARLVITGTRSEDGEASGHLPFRIAQRLSMPLLTNCVALAQESDGALTLVRAMDGGGRQIYRAGYPLLVTVGDAAPRAGLSVFARAREGSVAIHHAKADLDERVRMASHPSRPRPRPLAPGPQGGRAMDRLNAALGRNGKERAGGVLVPASAGEAAQAILTYLRQEGLLVSGERGPVEAGADRPQQSSRATTSRPANDGSVAAG